MKSLAGRALLVLRRGPRHLSTLLGVALSLAGLLAFGAIALIIAAAVSREFTRIERAEFERQSELTEAELLAFRGRIEKNVADWARWTDAYEYIATGDSAFTDENINPEASYNLDMDGLAFLRFDKAPREVVSYDRATGERLADVTQQLTALVQSDSVITRARTGEPSSFFVQIDKRVFAAAMSAIRRSDGSGTPEGALLMVRELEAIALERDLKIDARIALAGAARDPLDTPGYRMADGRTAVFQADLLGVDDARVATVTYDMPRTMMIAGRNLQLVMIAGVAVLLAVLIIVLIVILKHAVVVPLGRLERFVEEIGRKGELVEIADDGRRDEIGALARGFNDMIRQLRDLRARMEAQTFQLGRNQSAIGSLHNVKNGLSPITSLLSLLVQSLAFPAKADVLRALGELARDETPAARRQQLSAFAVAAVERVSVQLESAQTKSREALRAAKEVADAVVHEQAAAAGAIEPSVCDLTEAVSSALTIATYSNLQSGITVDFVDHQPRMVSGNRVLIGQVIGNLLMNSVEAIKASGHGQGCIGVRAESVVIEGQGMEQLTITDNGEGFDPAVRAKLFSRGFSTRTGKHGGLGLHWCANTINAMGGSLALDSDGPGQGARAVLRLPKAAAQSRAA